ncbi:MAG: hypothetical protein KJZ84_03730 [Bryobacteraceae bacterium]|nr:hypothetical protein [Bryobacteraceae bacterium]
MIRRHPDAFALLALGLALWTGAPSWPRVQEVEYRARPALLAGVERADHWIERFERRKDEVWRRLDERMREFERRLAEKDQRRRIRTVSS